MERRAKIMATLGPASRKEEVIAELFEAGVDVVRLNLSHGDHAGHRELIERVRRVAARQRRHVPVVLDLMGPRYRLGEIDGRRRLQKGAEVRLSRDGEEGDLPVEDEVLEHLSPGERVLIDNGLVELEVTSREADHAVARVVTGGIISTKKGINLPDSDLPFTISDKDRADIRFAVEQEVDYLAASYVGAAEHVETVRREVEAAGGRIPLVAKLERAAAVDALAAIVGAADALMVARGDLGVEVPLHRVPILQKRIVAAGRRAGKPVIVATQMLESMVEQPRPTRAEATDVANAVLDGTDVLMLSGETAAGQHPVAAVATMCRIIEEAEEHARHSPDAAAVPGHLLGKLAGPEGDLPDVVAAAAVHAAERLGVRWIVAFSQGGLTARLVARYRPRSPILVFSTDDAVARRVQLFWGARPLSLATEVEHHDEVVDLVERRLLENGLVEDGEVLIILMGDPIRERPPTNLMRLHRVEAGSP